MAKILDFSQRLPCSVRACLLFFFFLSESLALSLPPQSQQTTTSFEDPSSPYNLSSSLLPPFDLTAASGPCSSVSGTSTLTVGDVHCEGRDVSDYQLLVVPNICLECCGVRGPQKLEHWRHSSFVDIGASATTQKAVLTPRSFAVRHPS